MEKHVDKRIKSIDGTYNDMLEKLGETPKNEGEWVVLKQYIKEYKDKLLKLAEE